MGCLKKSETLTSTTVREPGHARPNVFNHHTTWVSRNLQETNGASLCGVQTKVPRILEPRMSQVSNRKMPDNEYISENGLPTIYSNIETPEQTVVPRDLTKASKNSRWNVPKRAIRNFQPQQASKVAIGNRYEVLQNEDTVNNYRGNKYNELPMQETEKSKMEDRVPREINPAPKGIPGKYGKRTEEEMGAIDSNEERFVATGKNIMPGIYDYNEVVKMRPTQARAGPPRNDRTSGKKVHGNAHERQDRRGNQSQRKPSLTIIGDSMVKQIRSQDISNECPSYKSYVKTFPEVRIDDMFSYVEPTINMNPSMVVLMCGTNNLRDGEPDRIANKLVDLALTANERADKVAVSSIVHRADSHHLEVKKMEVNRLVRESLKNHRRDFITHDNIKAQHTNKWGPHLNYNGNNLLAGNFIDFINSTVCPENRQINDEGNLDSSIQNCRPSYKRNFQSFTLDEEVD